MEITRQPVGETLVLTLKGRLDGAWSEHTGQTLERAVEEGWHRLDLDLSGVTFLSSAGIRILVVHFKQLHKIQGRLAVVRPSPETRQVLEMAGLAMLIAQESAVVSEGTASKKEGPETIGRDGWTCQFHPLAAGARLRARLLGGNTAARFPEKTLGLGHGAFGRDWSDAEGRIGEFLALGGVALSQPADGKQTTDYLVAQGELVPEVAAISGIVAEGEFAQLARFDARECAGGSVSLSALLALVLERCDGRAAGFALIAETASLVGAALTVQPEPGKGIAFDFPEIRNKLLFTAEPAWPRSLSLVAGFVAPDASHPLACQLRPVHSAPAAPLAHVHAAAFPYRPLPKGVLELGATVRQLLEEERALGLLHLLNDWRPAGGAGESRFNRGALWLAPLDSSASL